MLLGGGGNGATPFPDKVYVQVMGKRETAKRGGKNPKLGQAPFKSPPSLAFCSQYNQKRKTGKNHG